MQEQQSSLKPIRIVAMSDTHDMHHKIQIQNLPKGDIFIHAGDFTKFSGQNQLSRFRQFLKKLPYQHKIVIAGNHDFALDRVNYTNKLKNKHLNNLLNSQEEILKLKQCCTYLQHEFIQINGLRIFGSPYTPQFYDWGFMYQRCDGQKLFSDIPKNIDILITHGPPFRILDRTIGNEFAGCQALSKIVEIIKPQIHIFGHIHESYGKIQKNGTCFYNASTVNINYRVQNDPFVIDIVPLNKMCNTNKKTEKQISQQ